ncbi:MAG: hypothetical protein LBK55_08965 [Azoarcus sp.]|jgi:hypothetical protein|nr:hypothetical protein [Azoarcus sp.]
MKKIVLLIALSMLACAHPVWTQENVFQFKTLKLKNTKGSISGVIEIGNFPLLVSKNKRFAEKINTFLQVEELETILGTKAVTSGLASVTTSLASVSWEVLQTPGNILSISFAMEGCGAYCDNYDAYANFDTRTGDMILLRHLLTKEGFEVMNRKVKANKKATIRLFMKETREKLAKSVSKDDRELYKEQLFLYETCNTHDIDDDAGFYFTENNIVITSSRCSAHVVRAIDDLGTFSFAHEIEEMEKYLSPYGVSLLKGGQFVKNASIGGKMFKGTIGKYPVTALLTRVQGDNSFSMWYWYEKHMTLIAWSGKMHNGKTLTMTERDVKGDYKIVASIYAEIKDGGIQGVWKNSITGEKLSLNLVEY